MRKVIAMRWRRQQLLISSDIGRVQQPAAADYQYLAGTTVRAPSMINYIYITTASATKAVILVVHVMTPHRIESAQFQT